MSLDLEQIDHTSDSEINSSDLEDITDDDDENPVPESLCGFCQHPNAKKFVKQLYVGVKFCDKFCANRYHIKQTASLDENETNPKAGNEHAKKKVSTVVYIAPQYGSGTFLSACWHHFFT